MTEKQKPKGSRICLCGHWIAVVNGAGVCANCGRTLEQVREHDRERSAKRLRKRRAEKRKEVAEEGPDTPLYPMRRCHDCGVETWDYRCQKCQAKITGGK
jgi:hypothetical protein